MVRKLKIFTVVDVSILFGTVADLFNAISSTHVGTTCVVVILQ